MCIVDKHHELLEELECTTDNTRKKALLHELNTCSRCPEASEGKEIKDGDPNCSCRRTLKTEITNYIYSRLAS